MIRNSIEVEVERVHGCVRYEFGCLFNNCCCVCCVQAEAISHVPIPNAERCKNVAKRHRRLRQIPNSLRGIFRMCVINANCFENYAFI